MTHKPDDFEIRARNVLEGQSAELLAKLLALRAEVQNLSVSQWEKSPIPKAEELNEGNQRIFDRAAKLLGKENFERIFGFPPYEEIDLVDQRLLQQQIIRKTASQKQHAKSTGR